MSEKILLSICIPTFNRARYLDEAINSVVSQLTPEISGKVELCVSDNSSTDNTTEVVQKYISKNIIPIIYNKNAENLGADYNYLKVVAVSHGQYCWYLGSDDVIKPGAILQVITELNRFPEVDIFLSNRTACDLVSMEPLQEDIAVSSSSFGVTFDLSQNTDLIKYFDSCTRLMGVFSYISSIVFKKEKWDSVTGEEEFIGTAYVHVYKLLAGFKNGLSLKFIGKSFVNTRMGQDSFSKGGISRFMLDFDGYIPIARKLFTDIEVRRHFLAVLTRQHQFLTILWVRAKCSPSEWREVRSDLDAVGYQPIQYLLLEILNLPVRIFISIKHLLPT